MTTPDSALLIEDLGDGLVLRRCTLADAEAVTDFNARFLSDDGPDQPDEEVRGLTHDLIARPHPTVSASDFLVVEDTASGRVVSSTMLIPQTWAYGGTPFGVGRPELVATAPEYRRRGLVRRQFQILHRWSQERGHLVQAITGIPHYYRQFGYDMALNLDGGRSGFAPQVPPLEDGESEPYRVRPAAASDLPFIAHVYDQSVARRDHISVVRDQAQWRYELDGRSPGTDDIWELRLIETQSADPVGYLAHAPEVWTGGHGVRLVVRAYELAPGQSWLAVTSSVFRYIWQTGETYAARKRLTLQRMSFGLGEEHPIYAAFPEALPVVRRAYAWYLRVPDLPGFVRHVAPVLEQRLARSLAAGHSAELKLNFYRAGGLRLVLERGRLAAVEPWQAPVGEDGAAGFPNLTFLQLLFGYRSLDELRHAYADCYVRGDVNRALLTALFPKQPSNLWPIT